MRLVDVLVLPQGLDRGSISRIVSGMFPRDKVEEEIGVKIVACLGLGAERAPLPIQVWRLVAGADEGVVVEVAGHGLSVFDLAKGTSTVVRRDIQLPPLRHPPVPPLPRSKFNGRRYIAHLLFLLTTRSHVKAYRIQAMYVLL